jgi:hypothetical protein
MTYLRTKQEICSLATTLAENNLFIVPHFSYNTLKPHLDTLIGSLEYIVNLLNKAYNGKKVKYSESPEVYNWLMKQSSPVLEQYEP